MIVAVIVLAAVSVALLVALGVTLGIAADANDNADAKVRDLIDRHYRQIDRLMEAALAPDAGASLRKLEVTAQTTLARADLAARLNQERIDRRYEEQNDDRFVEHIGGIVP